MLVSPKDLEIGATESCLVKSIIFSGRLSENIHFACSAAVRLFLCDAHYYAIKGVNALSLSLHLHTYEKLEPTEDISTFCANYIEERSRLYEALLRSQRQSVNTKCKKKPSNRLFHAYWLNIENHYR